MSRFDINDAMARLAAAFPTWTDAPVLAFVAQHESDPFRVLVSCILSLRTLDQTTSVVAPRLFALAETPAGLLAIGEAELARLIYPVAFYRTKARQLIAIASRLIDDFDGQVPNELLTLLSLPGVGRKTANLVLVEGFELPGICVDTHVHRITNRWGYLRTKTPEKTELRLRAKLPRPHWRSINLHLVAFGQTICRPISPKCSICPLPPGACKRVGVTQSR